jgi:hypothetical protein
MTRNKTLYPNLTYFFSAYFHQDWNHAYDWQGERPSSEVVVRDFKAKNPEETVTQATRELEQFLVQVLAEGDLREVVVHELGANVYAPGLGLTYRQWLEAVLDILKEPRREEGWTGR